MRTKYLYTWLLLAAMCLFGAGCQTLEEEVSVEDCGVLKVKARSVQTEEAIYPMYLYAFSEEGACASSQVIESSEESMRLVLPAGNYRVVLVAGAGEGYTIPENPSLQDAVLLEDTSGAGTPLLVGMADVAVGAETEARLELTLSYAVAAVKVLLTDIPADVSAVTVTMSSFHSSMALSGEYGGEGCSLVMPCTLDTANVWSTDTCYVFPGNASETVFSIQLKMKDNTVVAYGYTWRDALEAGHPYAITGSYSSGIVLDGSFVLKGWDALTEISFQFGAGNQGDDGEGETPEEPSINLDGVPEVGSIWNGAIVAQVSDADESGADVLLLSLDEWSIVTSQVEELTSGYSVNGMADWRLPTYEEAQLLRNSFSDTNRLALNERIADYDAELVGIDGEERYLCDKSGVYYSFIFAGGTSITKAGSVRAYYTRLVKSCRVTF